MLNKNYLFGIISIFLGFIISFFYNQKINTDFIKYFILITLIIYLILYFLGSSKENFEDFYHTKIYNTIEESDAFKEEEEQNYSNLSEEENNYSNLSEEEELNKKKIFYSKLSKKNRQKLLSPNLSEEEEHIILDKIIEEEQIILNKIIEEEEQRENKPDISKFIMSSPIPGGYGPLNINISYNAQNSVNEVDNNKDAKNCTSTTPSTTTSTPTTPSTTSSTAPSNSSSTTSSTESRCSNNLNSDEGRIYNNSDWIYGNNAWTNSPDYYIPTEECNAKQIPKQLSELITTKRYKENRPVSPLMINTPWSEYKSGDSGPDTYNL